jgi:hypothetical protein
MICRTLAVWRLKWLVETVNKRFVSCVAERKPLYYVESNRDRKGRGLGTSVQKYALAGYEDARMKGEIRK